MYQKYQFHFRIKFFLFCLFFAILFFCLGIWQLHRYHYKKNLLENYAVNKAEARATSFLSLAHQNNLNFNPLEFKKISLQGKYIAYPIIFLTNRYHDDEYHHTQLGVEALKVIEIAHQDKWLLVDIGWIKTDANNTLPAVPYSGGEQRIQGYIKLNNEYQFILGDVILKSSPEYILMQKMDFKALERTTHHAFYPFILRLNSIQYPEFYRDWVISAVPPERHLGYAIQWFLMALVLLIAYIGFSCERKKTF